MKRNLIALLLFSGGLLLLAAAAWWGWRAHSTPGSNPVAGPAPALTRPLPSTPAAAHRAESAASIPFGEEQAWQQRSASTSRRPPAPAPESDPFLRQLSGRAGDGKLGTRLQALAALGQSMTAAQQQPLAEYLLASDRRGALTAEQDHVLVNETLKSLRTQDSPLPGLTEWLAQLTTDNEQDAVVRSYTLQHLADWYERAPDRERVLEILWGAAEDGDSLVEATALLNLQRLHETHTELDGARLYRAALRAVESAATPDAVRVTALQVCGRAGLAEALPLAVELAQHSPSVPVRISAIAVIGQWGGSEQMPMLERWADDPEARWRPAAKAAMANIQRRTGPRS